jgi:hypothetical protein
MDCIPELWRPIVDFLMKAPIAWQSPDQIATGLGWPLESTMDKLCAMDETGWISVWEDNQGVQVTLTVRSAELLQVNLIETGPEETPHWSPRGEPVPKPTEPKNVSAVEIYARQEQLIEPAPSPDLAAEGSERAEQSAAAFRQRLLRTILIEDLPLPQRLIGVNLTPWPGPSVPHQADACPACGGRPLRPQEYCLCCDRWGLDEVLAALLKNAPRCRSDAPEELRRNIQEPVAPDRKKRWAKRKARRRARAGKK